MALSLRPPSTMWRRLRRKDDTGTDDPDWAGRALSPNSFVVAVGGTASDGDYDIIVTPLQPDTYPPKQSQTLTAITTTFTRGSGEANSAIATALATAITTAIGADLEPYIESVRVTNSTDLEIVVRDDSPPFIVTTADPGTATLTATPDDIFPIARPFVHQRGDERSVKALDILFVAVSATDVPVADDNSTTLTVTPLLAATRESHTRSDLSRPGVARAVPTTLHSIQIPYEVVLNGADVFGVRMTDITTEPTDCDAIEVWYKEKDL